MATITVGPVVGKTTDTTARILIETDKDVEASCTAIDNEGNAFSRTRLFRKNIPSVFTLEELKPDTKYTVIFSGVDTNRKATFSTYPTDVTSLNIAAVSCNFTIKRGDTDLWTEMRNRYIRPGQIDIIIRIGDQIYGDNAFGQAISILNGKSKGKDNTILELYRNLYRMTWNYPPTQEVLAKTSNLMIWDDHEIRDDWGSRECDYDKASPEYHVGTLAREVFREYQRQLWEDINTDEIPNSGFEHHFHKWGSIGVLFLDQRGGRSFERDAQKPYLGIKQWDDISRVLSTDGFFSNVRALLVVTSVPLAYLSSAITTKGSVIDMVDDLKDHWAYSPHRKEQIEMIRLLRTWKEAMPGRDLLVIGGDVHVGGHTSIKHYDKEIFKQLITSPITNTPPDWYEFYGIRILMESKETIGSSYSFEHYDFTRRRNFGVILVRVPADTGKPKIDGTLVEATPK